MPVPYKSDLYTQLRIDILRGKLTQGQKLTEQEICSVYKISRTPVREAFCRLEAEGLIESIPNRGAFVTSFTPRELRDMFDLRKAYEIQAVKWAIERIDDEQMDTLEETFEFMEFYTQKNDVEKMLNINMSFHQSIYNAAQNKMLAHVLSSYQTYLKYMIKEKQTDDGYLPALLAEHRVIFNAFKAKDPLMGVRAMEKHMDNSIARKDF